MNRYNDIFFSSSPVSEVEVFTVWDNSNAFSISADIFCYFGPEIRTLYKRNGTNIKLKQQLSINHKNSKKKL